MSIINSLYSHKKYSVVLFSLILFWAIVSVYADSSNSFTIVWISDTQYLSQHNPIAFDSLCDWIVSNVQNYNIKMVVHSGDIVNYWNYTDQWENANSSMAKLLDNYVPYGWCAGNHDQEDYGDQDGTWIGDNYLAFNSSLMSRKSFWVGDLFEGKNTAQIFKCNEQQILVIQIENRGNSSIIEWTNKLIHDHPNAQVLIVTHAIFDYYGEYTKWAINLKEQVLSKNPNVFMVISGHESGSITREEHYETHKIFELMFNKQEEENGGSYIRLLIFNTSDNTVSVKTYSPYLDDWLNEPSNEFMLKTSFPEPITEQIDLKLFVIFLFLVAIILVYRPVRQNESKNCNISPKE